MSEHDALLVARRMAGRPSHLALSSRTNKMLAERGCATIGAVVDLLQHRDLANPGRKLSSKRWNEISEALRVYCVMGVGAEFTSSYLAAAGRAYHTGLKDGVAETEQRYLTQTVSFETSSNFALERLKDRIIEAYASKAKFVAGRLLMTYKVPGIGPMHATVELTFEVDGVAKMVQAWDPLKPEDVKCTCVVLLDRVNPRECEITINFLTGKGIMVLQPPTEEARKRFEQILDLSGPSYTAKSG